MLCDDFREIGGNSSRRLSVGGILTENKTTKERKQFDEIVSYDLEWEIEPQSDTQELFASLMDDLEMFIK